jgi:hypothetical protein
MLDTVIDLLCQNNMLVTENEFIDVCTVQYPNCYETGWWWRVFWHYSYLRLSCSACICIYNRVYQMNRCHIRRYPLRVSPNQGPYRPIRARLAQSGPVSPNQGPARRPMRGRLEEHLYHLNIREEAGGIVWVNPSSKCASCHSNEMHQRIIHTH